MRPSMLPCSRVHILCLTPSDDTADGHGTVPHESGKPSERGALHLVVCQTVALEVEALNLLIELGVLQREAQLATLGTVESISSDGVPAQDVILTDLLDEALVCSHDVGAQASIFHSSY